MQILQGFIQIETQVTTLTRHRHSTPAPRPRRRVPRIASRAVDFHVVLVAEGEVDQVQAHNLSAA